VPADPLVSFDPCLSICSALSPTIFSLSLPRKLRFILQNCQCFTDIRRGVPGIAADSTRTATRLVMITMLMTMLNCIVHLPYAAILATSHRPSVRRRRVPPAALTEDDYPAAAAGQGLLSWARFRPSIGEEVPTGG